MDGQAWELFGGQIEAEWNLQASCSLFVEQSQILAQNCIFRGAVVYLL